MLSSRVRPSSLHIPAEHSLIVVLVAQLKISNTPPKLARNFYTTRRSCLVRLIVLSLVHQLTEEFLVDQRTEIEWSPKSPPTCKRITFTDRCAIGTSVPWWGDGGASLEGRGCSLFEWKTVVSHRSSHFVTAR